MRKTNQELALLQERFRNFYNENLGNKFVELESHRIKHLHFFWKWLVLLFLIGIGLVWLCQLGIISEKIYTSELGDYGVITYFVVIYVVLNRPFQNYKSETKKLTMNKILSFFGEFVYQDGGKIDCSDIEKSNLFGYFDTQFGDDYFKGSYKDVQIEVSEERLTKKVRTKNGTRDATVFKGIIIALAMNKDFSGQTVVRKDWGIFNFLMRTPHYQIKKENIKLQNVKLEDCIFEKEFEVFSNDQIVARYILTTVFMERILEIKKRFHGRQIQFSFFDNKLFIAVKSGKDMFETTSLFSTTASYGKMREVVSQFYAIFSIIEVLKLNKRLGM